MVNKAEVCLAPFGLHWNVQSKNTYIYVTDIVDKV